MPLEPFKVVPRGRERFTGVPLPVQDLSVESSDVTCGPSFDGCRGGAHLKTARLTCSIGHGEAPGLSPRARAVGGTAVPGVLADLLTTCRHEAVDEVGECGRRDRVGSG